jgi:hypothetical protein
MKKTFILGAALMGLVAFPGAALTQNKTERVDTTFTTPVDATFAGCTEPVHVTGTLVTTVKAGHSAGDQVHNITRVRLTDVRAVGVTSGAEYKVTDVQTAQRSYEFGGTERHVAHARQQVRVTGPGPGNTYVTTIKWQYRQDQDGNVVVNDLQTETSGCK